MNNEIKQGDKVRVSGHYIAMIITGGIVRNALNNATFVVDNIDREGRMAYVSCKLPISLQSPIAHLIKVDAETKERKIECGDKVLAMKTDQIAPSSEAETFRRNVSLVTKIKNGIASLFIIDRYGANHYARTAVEFLQKVTDEPTEQTETEKSFEDQLRDALNGAEHQDFGYPMQTAMINLNINDWDAYAADLAKEIVLKTVNSASDRRPSAIAEYAVSIAKTVVNGLKRE